MKIKRKLILLAALLTLSLFSASCGGGDSATIHLELGKTYIQNIAASGTNYYSFTTRTSGPRNISVVYPMSNVSWSLHSDAGYTAGSLIDSCDNSIINGAETCWTSTLLGTYTYYLRVDEWNNLAGTYTLLIL